MKSDFSGFATKSNIRCSDGKTISPNAFIGSNGKKVPLVWMHDHADPGNVLGHCELENRPDGVYCQGFFNNTKAALAAKEAVKHGDVDSLSIYANHLKFDGRNHSVVEHGEIKEVSLVLAGANPGAKIDTVAIQHADGTLDALADEAVMTFGETIQHSDDDDEPKDTEAKSESKETEEDDPTIKDVYDSLTPLQQKALNYLVGVAKEQGITSDELEHADEDEAEDDDDGGEGPVEIDGTPLPEILDSLTKEQTTLFNYMVGQVIEDNNGTSDNKEDDSEEEDKGDSTMTHSNIFERNGQLFASDDEELIHADEFAHDPKAVAETFNDAMTDTVHYGGSLKKAVIEHADQGYGIENIDLLFPDAQAIRNTPDFYKRRTEWVNTVLTGTSHVPFSRIKTLVADITADEARAKGYVKGKKKIEEVFPLLRRTTDPQTIYKKQKLDRDDIVDITSFDVVAWLKQEMRIQLDEEIARAVLIGDGRAVDSPDRIDPTHIRPIATDDDLYTIKKVLKADATPSDIVDEIQKSLTDYLGSGNPTFFATPQMIAELFTERDSIKRRLYANRQELADQMGISSIVEVPILQNAPKDGDNTLVGIIGNLRDYTIGADRGGDVSMFDDFDIDFNQQKYLIESRASGAITLPKSFIAVWKKGSATPANPSNTRTSEPSTPANSGVNH